MSAALTVEEQNDLLEIIDVVFGYNSEFHSLKQFFNEKTVDVVEIALNELLRCNESMKLLIAELVGATAILTKGWLKRALNVTSYVLKNERVKLNGLGCRERVISLYSNEVRTSVYL